MTYEYKKTVNVFVNILLLGVRGQNFSLITGGRSKRWGNSCYSLSVSPHVPGGSLTSPLQLPAACPRPTDF